ncbi:putative receptor-like protein kinase At4g00960 [Chenopodium quinoa]|uniref:Uncharacterized protein n=1 Tax=Chenopodium quinoa TaxID=63459 RepID=A0A803L1E3_CHEQI|nr:putative receptor-like protein kinase At4g00960 [Chenopodium quinoa]
MMLNDILLFPGFIREILPLIFFLLNIHFFSITADVTLLADKCDSKGDPSKVIDDRGYAENVNKLLSDLSSKASDVKFYNSTVGDTPNKVHGLFQCREDLSLQVCRECIDVAAKYVNEKCPLYESAILWYMECSVWLCNSSISLEDVTKHTLFWGSSVEVANPSQVNAVLTKTFDSMIKDAANDSSPAHIAMKEATFPSSSARLYCLTQCARILDGSECAFCLKKALNTSANQFNRSAQEIFLPGCRLMYNTSLFYNVSYLSSPSPSSTSPSSIKIKSRGRPLVAFYIGGIAASAAIGAILFLSATWFCLRRRKMKMRFQDMLKETSNSRTFYDDMEDIRNIESLRYEFSTIKTATDNFSKDSKLGMGGFGEVYKGRLENGKEIAVKRLSESSEQGTLEFKNEVLLVAKLQHRNLVKLLGFCLSEKEKILIYEFLPNLSLDRFLYDPLKRASLDWNTRFKIIIGIARGLLYLHEDSRLKIIHRDLKSSNVLLDKAMDAKISDFGLAKLFKVDQTQGDTKRIIGTYGYMAPEYAIAGQFSVKSDVYSFGVIVLEVVTGQRNNIFGRQQHEEGLLHRAWRLWNDEAVLELVDPSLENNFSVEEVNMCIHIGLLCVQEDATKRPRMTSVVAALNGQSVILPLPNTPHFLTANVDTDEPLFDNHIINEYTGTRNITEFCPR